MIILSRKKSGKEREGEKEGDKLEEEREKERWKERKLERPYLLPEVTLGQREREEKAEKAGRL